MPFQPGQPKPPGSGRQRGTLNRRNLALNNTLQDFLLRASFHLDEVMDRLRTIDDPVAFFRAYTRIARLVSPRGGLPEATPEEDLAATAYDPWQQQMAQLAYMGDHTAYQKYGAGAMEQMQKDKAAREAWERAQAEKRRAAAEEPAEAPGDIYVDQGPIGGAFSFADEGDEQRDEKKIDTVDALMDKWWS